MWRSRSSSLVCGVGELKLSGVKSARINKFVKPTIIAVVGLSLLLIYYYVDPVSSWLAQFMPKCMLKTLTGYDCPSCGIQRALHAVLNGELRAAFWLNPFLALALPYLALLLYVTLSDDRVAQRLKPYVRHRYVAYAYIVLYFVWWILRNTPWWLELVAGYQ